MLSLGTEFDIFGKILFDLFSGGKPVIACAIEGSDARQVVYSQIIDEFEDKVENWNKIESKTDEQYRKEAESVIERTKKIYSSSEETNPVMDEILKDFDYMYKKGKKDFRLARLVGNSEWVRVELEGDCYHLGKVYNNGRLSHILIAIPQIGGAGGSLLGKGATFVKASIYDDFGYLILKQNTITGMAEKVS